MDRYRFGLGITDFLICRACGVYVSALVEEADGLLATLIVNTLDLPQDGFPDPVQANYDDENEEQRLARRRLALDAGFDSPACRARLTTQESDFRESSPCR